MSEALLIAIVATTIAGLIVGAVTWMLVLPARAARSDSRVLPQAAPPLAYVERLLAQLGGPLAEPCVQVGPPDAEVLRKERQALLADDEREAAQRWAQVLSRLGDDDPAVKAHSREVVPPPPVYHLLSDELWLERVSAPALDPALTAIMALLGPEVITWHAHPAQRYGLERSQRVESLSAPPRISELVMDVARAVGVPAPILFITPEREARLIHINLAVAGRYHAALAVGKQALKITDEAVLRFLLGRKLTFMRPEHLLCTEVDGPDDLLGLHLAIAKVLTPGVLSEPPEHVSDQPVEQALERLRARFSEAELAEPMRHALAAAGRETTRERWEMWLDAAQETSFRCGLLLSGDLRAALRILEMDDLKSGTDREQELCYNALYRFFVSDSYETLRQELAKPDTEAAPTSA